MTQVRNRWLNPGPHNGDDIVEFVNHYFAWVQTNTTTQTAEEILYNNIQNEDPDMWNVVSKYAPDIIGERVIGGTIPPHINPFELEIEHDDEELFYDEEDDIVEQEININNEVDLVINNNGRNECYKCNMRTKEISGIFASYNICENKECEWYDN